MSTHFICIILFHLLHLFRHDIRVFIDVDFMTCKKNREKTVCCKGSSRVFTPNSETSSGTKIENDVGASTTHAALWNRIFCHSLLITIWKLPWDMAAGLWWPISLGEYCFPLNPQQQRADRLRWLAARRMQWKERLRRRFCQRVVTSRWCPVLFWELRWVWLRSTLLVTFHHVSASAPSLSWMYIRTVFWTSRFL